MSDYEYIDSNGARFKIGPTIDNRQAFIQIRDVETSIAGYIANKDAPAVALAILEAAHVDKVGKIRLASALSQLSQYVTEQVERDAEEAAAADWWNETRYGHTIGASWADLSASARIDALTEWRRNRDYFAKIDAEIVPAEIVEPRIVQCGDPEPDRDAKWRDAEGDVWRWNETGWSCRSYRHGWGDIGYHVFPWTEVL